MSFKDFLVILLLFGFSTTWLMIRTVRRDILKAIKEAQDDKG